MAITRIFEAKHGGFSDQIEQALGKVLDREALLCDPKREVLVDAARHITFAGSAKRARPQLCERFGAIVGASRQSVTNVAMAAEWIHTASLLHDDVVDDGQVRRGKPTVNVRWKNSTAVLSGDLLLSLAIQALVDEPVVITHKATAVVAEMARGSILEVRERGKVDVGIDTYEQIVQGKTGALFGFCGFGVGALSGDLAVAKRFEKAARALGNAFQIADDMRDLVALEDDKDRLADMREKMPSFPTVFAAARSKRVRAEIERAWSQKKVSRATAVALKRSILETDALDTGMQMIEASIAQAKRTLSPWKESPAAAQIVSWGQTMARTLAAELAVAHERTSTRSVAVQERRS